ncbi:MAG: mitochondrial fission ELM1 family protein [Proteobacteria bacterium]|nr:mitochondrial fission ELM1 family protein [Pseudomonadota bacterium]
MKRFFFSLGLLSFFSVNAHATIKLYITANPTNAGDVSQVEGIKAALLNISDSKISSEFIDSRRMDIILQKLDATLASNEKVILVGAGEGGVDGIESLPSNPNMITCLTSHMLLERYKDPILLDKLTFIALPTHVSLKDKELIASKLIETVGVAHNRTPEGTEKTYNDWSKELPVCSSYVGVILGGDAPLPPPAKGLKRFTENDALNLANYVVPLAKEKNACVVVLNGPRTGKYDANQEEVLTVHRQGYSDPVTEFFLQKLQEAETQVAFFDFQHKTPENAQWVKPYNAFELVVGALQTQEGLLLVPGESTSMISEAIDTLPSEKVLVYKNAAMNDVHEAHVASELAAGRVTVLENYRHINKLQSSPAGPPSSAAMIIAQRLLDEATSKWQKE